MTTQGFAEGIGVFIMPHRIPVTNLARIHLDEAIESIERQTDKNWQLVIIDDYSQNVYLQEHLQLIKKRLQEKVHLIFLKEHVGTGQARNIGIQYANKIGAPFVLFNDTDDLSHCKRLELARQAFIKNSDANVVYTSFNVIDEYDHLVGKEKICGSVYEILEGHKENIVNGDRAWIKIATEKNYTNLTSCTAVRTSLAIKEPFPKSSVSEDSHTWLRYGAHSGKFIFLPNIKNAYRTCSGTDSRSRKSNNDFYEQKLMTDMDGFEKAAMIAISNRTIDVKELPLIRIGFYVRLSHSMLNGNSVRLAAKCLNLAFAISKEETLKVIKTKIRDINIQRKLFDILKGEY